MVVGWGALVSLTSAVVLLLSLVDGDPTDLKGFGILDWTFRHQTLLAGVQFVLALLTALCGVAAWRGRPAARRASQVLMVLWALLFCAGGIVMAATFKGFPNSGPLLTHFFGFWRINAVIGGFVWAALASIPVYLLQRVEVRDWFNARERWRADARSGASHLK
jgi:hypothetical protein